MRTSKDIFWPVIAVVFADVQGFYDFLQALFWLVFWVSGIFGATSLIHFLFSLPMRRAERARLFLDLVEDALKRGQSIEEMILSLAAHRDRTLGVRFHLLAAYIESGMRFGEALNKVSRFLPPQISEMINAGGRLGDLRRVLPACREILRDHPAGVRSAMNYLILVVLLFTPAYVTVVWFTSVFVIPRFMDVANGMDVRLRPETLFVFSNSQWMIFIETGIFLLFVAAIVAYIGGPGLTHVIQRALSFPFIDWISWRVPWKRKRLQQTFSAMLAVLLDGGVPEAEAILIAGDCTANGVCRVRADRILTELQLGKKLDDAVRVFDDSGEFHWRLANAVHARGGFLKALRGWHEMLDAKAFQQEEVTAHIATTGIVVLNGVLVALIATAMFGIFVVILNGEL